MRMGLLCVWLGFVSMVLAQTDSVLVPLKTYDFLLPSQHFDVDNSGNIYLTHTQTNQITRINTEVKPCTLQTVGGRGMSVDRFNHPTEIISKNRQNILVLDTKNQRIVSLNELFRYLDEVSFSKIESPIQNPAHIAQNLNGDLYIIDENVPQVSKFSGKGVFINSFGSYDWGEGSLTEPNQIEVSNANFVYVWDKAKQKIKKYDIFGTYLSTLNPSIPTYKKFAVSEPYLMYIQDKKVAFYNQLTHKTREYVLNLPENIIDIHVTEPINIVERLKNKDLSQSTRYIYVLLNKQIQVFEITL